MENISSMSFDNAFKKVDGLKWQPWVGEAYEKSSRGKRILIVGESHYLPEEEEDWYECVDTEGFTRGFIIDNVFHNPKKNVKILRTVENVVLGEVLENEKLFKFWKSVCFYNFIQKSLESSAHRPTDKNFEDGWNCFYKVLNVLQPDVCLFCGVRSADFNGVAKRFAEENGYQFIMEQTTFESNGVKARKKVLNKDGKNIPLIFICHPSYKKGFTISNWQGYVAKELQHFTENIHH